LHIEYLFNIIDLKNCYWWCADFVILCENVSAFHSSHVRQRFMERNELDICSRTTPVPIHH